MTREEELLQKLVDMEAEKKRIRLEKEERYAKSMALLGRIFLYYVGFQALTYVLFQLAVSYNIINF